MRMRALPSDGNHVAAAESNSGAMGDTVILGEAMRARLRELGAPIYGTKSRVWLCLCDHELMECEREAEDAFLTKRREHLQSPVELVAPQLLPTPVPPSLKEVKRHKVTHLPPAKCWDQCVVARAPDAPHSMPKANTPERLSVFASGFCLLKTGGDHGATEDENAANLIAVDADTRYCPPKATSDNVLRCCGSPFLFR